MNKTVNWYVYNGEILEADYINNRQEAEPEPDKSDKQWSLVDYEWKLPAAPVKEFDPEQVITYTGQVLYIGQDDIVLQDIVLRQIKFIVVDPTGLVWALLPVQVKYCV